MYIRAAAVVLLATAATAAASEDARPLKEARSENGLYRLRIETGRPGDGGRACRGALYAKEERGRRRVWRETLANETAPCVALIRNDGGRVVTLDEFERGGAAHALVVYDEKGKRLREFGLREMLGGADWKHVRAERRAAVWLEGATYGFSEEGREFWVRLEHGREVRIDLEKACIAGEDGKATSRPTAGEIPAEIAALLGDGTCLAAGVKEAVELSEGDRVEEAVRIALLSLKRLAAAAGLEIEGLNKVEERRGGTKYRELAYIPEAAATDEELGFVTAGNSGTTGLPVPAPDPRDPVNYMEWLSEMYGEEGAGAVPYYRAAFENVQAWEGDPELYDAAMAGDPNALKSDAIQAWLAANQEAIAQYREATLHEYHGMPVEDAEGLVFQMLLPNLSGKRGLTKMTLMEGRSYLNAGEVDEAFARYLDAMAAGGQTGQGLTLIEELVGIAEQALASEYTLDAMAEVDDEEIDYAALCEEMEERITRVRPIEDSFQFERISVLDIVQRMYEFNPETGAYRVREEGVEEMFEGMGMPSHGGGDLAMGYILGQVGFARTTEEINEHYDRATEATRAPFQEARRRLQELDGNRRGMHDAMSNPLLSMFSPAVERAYVLSVRAESARRATKLAANLKAYRQKYGEYPESLEAFGDAEMAYDPYTDDYFVYRREGDDFTLYSLSENGEDDGGVHNPRRGDGDVVYWPRPPKEK